MKGQTIGADNKKCGTTLWPVATVRNKPPLGFYIRDLKHQLADTTFLKIYLTIFYRSIKTDDDSNNEPLTLNKHKTVKSLVRKEYNRFEYALKTKDDRTSNLFPATIN